MSSRTLGVLGVAAGLALALVGCATDTNTPRGASFGEQVCGQNSASAPHYEQPFIPRSGAASTLSGAGSSFAAPLMAEWTRLYRDQAEVEVSYQSVGSGQGVSQIQAGAVDFGASDTGMTEADIAAAKGPVLQVPLLLGAVVPAYNLAGIDSGVKFTGEVLGRIYAGAITRWNDPALTTLNPDVGLPDKPITVVHRSDGSGTTGIWTDYLTKASPDWVAKLGGPATAQGRDVAWPTGTAAKGNEGVTDTVKTTDGALGYVELRYALDQDLSYGQVRNTAGKFIQPCAVTVTKAVNGVAFPANLNISLTNGADADAYPIAGTTYALIYQNQTDPAKAAGLVNFLGWALSAGQDSSGALSYAPLGGGVQRLAVEQLKKITVNGTTVLEPTQG